MHPDQERVKRILAAAADLDAGPERNSYLDQACGGDTELRAEVEELLAAYTQAGDFLDLPGVNANGESWEAAGTVIGRYRLIREIGEGTFGRVFAAQQSEPIKRTVALKIIKPGMDTREVIARFEAERQALALMDHPNIAQVFDAGTTESGRPYFVMELVRGLPIVEYCDQKQLAMDDRLKLFMGVCHAVQHAHQKGVIHRDLKPTNILITQTDQGAVPKIIDFGVAKALAQKLTDKTLFTAFTQMIGTPAYMSPEQAEMSTLDIDTRSDIYSLGVLLYELLTGKTPFDTKELVEAGLDEMRRIIRTQEPPRPSARLSTLKPEERTTTAKRRQTEPPRLIHFVQGDLDWIVMKCLEKDRTRRYETANALTQDIERHLGNEPVLARPPSLSYRLVKAAQRHQVMFVGSAIIVALLLTGIVVSSWQARVANRARREADQARDKAEAAEKTAETRSAEARDALAQSDFLQAIRLVSEDRDHDAVAYLVRCLRVNPSHEAAALRLTTLLTYRSWCEPLIEPLRHDGCVLSAEFSPDGNRILTSSDDSTTRVWEAKTGRPLTDPLKHSGPVRSAHFSPDGTRIVTASPNTVQIWDAQTGKPLTEPLRLSPYGISSVRFSPDGRRLVTISGATVHLWDAQAIEPLASWEGQAPRGSRRFTRPDARFSPDGSRVAMASSDGTVRILDALTADALTEPLRHGAAVNSVRFSPDGASVLTASSDRTVRLWDAFTGKPVAEQLTHASGVLSAEFSPDGSSVLTTSIDLTARVWNPWTGRPLTEPLRHPSRLLLATFSPDGKRFVTACEDGTAHIWNAFTGRALAEPIQHFGAVRTAQFSPDGQALMTASDDGTVRVWKTHYGRLLPEPPKKLGAGTLLQYTPDGTRFVVVSNMANSTARLCDAQTGKPLAEPLKHAGGTVTAQFSPNGKKLVTACADGTARVWDAQAGQPLTQPLPGGGWSAEFSQDGNKLVTWSSDYVAQVWEAKSTRPSMLLSLRGIIRGPKFSPDGNRLVALRPDTSAQLWDLGSGKPLGKPLRPAMELPQAPFSADGKLVLTIWDKEVQVWDASTGQAVGPPFKHSGLVRAARFSPDGKSVVTVSNEGDGAARLWDTKTGRPLTDRLKIPVANFAIAEFSPSGNLVLTASDVGYPRLWDARTGQPITEELPEVDLSTSERQPLDWDPLVCKSIDRTSHIWYIGPDPRMFPIWLVDLAEALCGEEVTGQGVKEVHNRTELLKKVRESVGRGVGGGAWIDWGRWFLADPGARTIAPFSKVTVPQWIRNRVAEGTTNSLVEALHIAVSTGNANPLRDIEEVLLTWSVMERGDLFFKEGRYSEAEAVYRGALDVRRKLFGKEHIEVANALESLARVFEAQERLADAESALREVCAIRLISWPRTRNALNNTIARIARVLRRETKLADIEAIPTALDSRFKDPSLTKQLVNDAAWSLATSHDPTSRDGLAAILLAQQAIEGANEQKAMFLDTLAAAYAEAGQFEKAIASQKEAISASGDNDPKQDYVRRLKLYESSSPYRE